MADDRPSEELEPREPSVEDLRELCRALNQSGVRYIVVGGFAMRAANYSRQTMDIDLLVAADPENEAKIYLVLSAAKDLVVHEVDGVPIPFASPRLLWRMKAVTGREKDAADLVFLRQWFAQRREKPPDI